MAKKKNSTPPGGKTYPVHPVFRKIWRSLVFAAEGNDDGCVGLRQIAMCMPDAFSRERQALLTIADKLEPKPTRRSRGRNPTPDWQRKVAMTALLLELGGMEEADAKACAANRWGRNLRSVQRYVAKNRPIWTDMREIALTFAITLDWQGVARLCRLEDDEARKVADYFSLHREQRQETEIERQLIDDFLSRQKTN